MHTPPGLDLAGEANAIWMCETHGSLIDKNGGADYSPLLLLKWKENAEARARLRQHSSNRPSPRLDALSFPRQTLKGMQLDSMRVELSKLTVIEANDTLPLDLIARCVGLAANAPSKLSTLVYGGGIDFTISYSPGYKEPTRVSLGVDRVQYWDGYRPRESIEGFYDARLVDFDSLRSMIPSDDELSLDPSERDHNQVLTGSAHPDSMIANRIARSLQTQDTIAVRDIRRGDEGWEVNTKNHPPDHYYSIENLSGSEATSLHLDLAIAAIRLREKIPQVLVINNLLFGFDSRNLRRFDAVCGELPDNVQVVLLDSTHRLGNLLGWHTERLRLENDTFPYPVRRTRSLD